MTVRMTPEPSGAQRLFGTDGIRGVANREPITSETSLQLGRAIAYVLEDPQARGLSTGPVTRKGEHRRRILIGKDTRVSGYMIETALASGICSMGADVLLVGPLPTPGVAFLTRSMRADAGVVISASQSITILSPSKLRSRGNVFFKKTMVLPTASAIRNALPTSVAMGR